jgi:hypothetical protein
MSVEDAQPVAPEAAGVVGLTQYELQRVGWFEELGFGTFEELGFGTFEALALATARGSDGQLVSVHDVRKAIERDCSVELAFQIFR